MSGAHAYLPPSGAGSWVYCAMWALMNRLYPSEDTQESREGTAAHWVFVEQFWNRPVTLASVAENGIPVSQKMIDGGALYVRTVDEDLVKLGLNRSVLRVEEPVAIPSVHEANWGTPDTWFIQDEGSVWLYDYKFGHRFVDSFGNWQLIDYALGVADKLQIYDPATRFNFAVIQPRNYDGDGPVRRWTCTLAELRVFASKLKTAAIAAVAALVPGAPPATATPGAHCYECPGRHACKPLQQSGYKGVWLSGQSVPVILSDEALGMELKLLRDAAEILKHRIGGLEADAIERMTRKGRRVLHFAMEQSLGMEGWKVPDDQVIAMGKLFGKQLGKTKALTPKQAVAAGMPSELVAPLIKQETKGLKLVEDDGKKAAKAFGSR